MNFLAFHKFPDLVAFYQKTNFYKFPNFSQSTRGLRRLRPREERLERASARCRGRVIDGCLERLIDRDDVADLEVLTFQVMISDNRNPR